MQAIKLNPFLASKFTPVGLWLNTFHVFASAISFLQNDEADTKFTATAADASANGAGKGKAGAGVRAGLSPDLKGACAPACHFDIHVCLHTLLLHDAVFYTRFVSSRRYS
jgi:hypothetical protein